MLPEYARNTIFVQVKQVAETTVVKKEEITSNSATLTLQSRNGSGKALMKNENGEWKLIMVDWE